MAKMSTITENPGLRPGQSYLPRVQARIEANPISAGLAGLAAIGTQLGEVQIQAEKRVIELEDNARKATLMVDTLNRVEDLGEALDKELANTIDPEVRRLKAEEAFDSLENEFDESSFNDPTEYARLRNLVRVNRARTIRRLSSEGFALQKERWGLQTSRLIDSLSGKAIDDSSFSLGMLSIETVAERAVQSGYLNDTQAEGFEGKAKRQLAIQYLDNVKRGVGSGAAIEILEANSSVAEAIGPKGVSVLSEALEKSKKMEIAESADNARREVPQQLAQVFGRMNDGFTKEAILEAVQEVKTQAVNDANAGYLPEVRDEIDASFAEYAASLMRGGPYISRHEIDQVEALLDPSISGESASVKGVRQHFKQFKAQWKTVSQSIDRAAVNISKLMNIVGRNPLSTSEEMKDGGVWDTIPRDPRSVDKAYRDILAGGGSMELFATSFARYNNLNRDAPLPYPPSFVSDFKDMFDPTSGSYSPRRAATVLRSMRSMGDRYMYQQAKEWAREVGGDFMLQTAEAVVDASRMGARGMSLDSLDNPTEARRLNNMKGFLQSTTDEGEAVFNVPEKIFNAVGANGWLSDSEVLMSRDMVNRITGLAAYLEMQKQAANPLVGAGDPVESMNQSIDEAIKMMTSSIVDKTYNFSKKFGYSGPLMAPSKPVFSPNAVPSAPKTVLKSEDAVVTIYDPQLKELWGDAVRGGVISQAGKEIGDGLSVGIPGFGGKAPKWHDPNRDGVWRVKATPRPDMAILSGRVNNVDEEWAIPVVDENGRAQSFIMLGRNSSDASKGPRAKVILDGQPGFQRLVDSYSDADRFDMNRMSNLRYNPLVHKNFRSTYAADGQAGLRGFYSRSFLDLGMSTLGYEQLNFKDPEQIKQVIESANQAARYSGWPGGIGITPDEAVELLSGPSNVDKGQRKDEE